jgi:hypothetical protein
MGIFCACVPTLGPMFRLLRARSHLSELSGSKGERMSRFLFLNLRQRLSPTKDESSASRWPDHDQHVPTEAGD